MMFYKEASLDETQIGGTPKDWKIVKLRDVCELRPGRSKKAIKAKEVAFIPMELIPEDGVYVDFEMRDLNGVSSCTYCEPGDILLAKITPSLENGKQGVVPNNIPYGFGLATTEVFPIVSRDIDRMFLFYSLRFRKYRAVIEASMRATTGRLRVPKDALLNLRISPPRSTEEQREVARVLSTLDEAIQRTNEIIVKTERLKKGLMQELLTKGIGHKEFRDTDIGTIPRQWKASTVGRECIVGTGGTPSRKHAEYFGGSIPWVKSTEVDYGVITRTEERITELGLQNSNAKIHPKGTLVMAMYGQGITRGKCAILGVDAAINQACAAITPRNSDIIYIPYLYHWCQSRYEHIRNLGQGANQPNLNLSLVRSVKVALPSFPEQRRIAQTLSTADKKLELERDEKAKLERIKRGVMDLLLTGKIRVRVS